MKIILIPTMLALSLLTQQARAQSCGIGFRNEVKAGVVVQGTSQVNSMPRRGQPILLTPGRIGWDNNVPAGIRYITIYDASQPSRVLLQNYPVPIQNQDMFFKILPHPSQSGRVILAVGSQP